MEIATSEYTCVCNFVICFAIYKVSPILLYIDGNDNREWRKGSELILIVNLALNNVEDCILPCIADVYS
jgi:hypothetical protein